MIRGNKIVLVVPNEFREDMMTVKSHSGCWIELGFKSSVEPAENIGDYRITKTVLPMHDPRNPNPAAGSFTEFVVVCSNGRRVKFHGRREAERYIARQRELERKRLEKIPGFGVFT